MSSNLVVEDKFTSSQLVKALDLLGIPFLRGAAETKKEIKPEILLATLANSPEARLRLALIPLFLTHPEFSTYTISALQQLPPTSALTLRCYYTAAYWLQKKYRIRLVACFGVIQPLPDLFGTELGLSNAATPDEALHALAQQQQIRSGRVLNWFGSYEHAIKSWLRFLEQEVQWMQSPPSN